jgi:asparagine synthase (glutamine-hydrolysing)
MCGIAGLAEAGPSRLPVPPREAVSRMLATLAHRGPDGEGIEALDGAALGHRRLAIIDLSERARQPMPLRCAGQGDAPPAAWLVFNGEIYNHAELRLELEGRGHRFHSGSDTEVLLHLYEERGADAVGALRGMFAFALWDARARRLILGRDRLGKKPLYYRERPDGLAFASEIKALATLARLRGEPVEPDAAALRRYVALKYVPGDRTAYAGVRRLPAGSLLIYQDGRAQIRAWWTIPPAAQRPPANPQAARGELDAALREAVRLRLRSDVPLGIFLSGGLDSSLLAMLVSRLVRDGHVPSGVLRTFTVGFAEADYDEMRHAAAVARALGTRHEEIPLRPTPADTREMLPRLAWHLDQPFADSSALAVAHLARAVRRHVTVALSGDGADELFLGYERYRAHRLAARMGALLGGGAALGQAVRLASMAVRALAREAPGRRNLAGRARRFLEAARLPVLDRNDAWITVLDGEQAASVLTGDFLRAAGDDPLEEIHQAYAEAMRGVSDADPLTVVQRADLKVWLPDDILHKLDAATMAHGLEARAPFLDHEVVEAAQRLPASMKLRRGQGKAVLREMYGTQLPDGVVRRRKKGFGLPLDHWLRGELGSHARDVLLDPATLARGLTRAEGVRRLLDEHRSGRANHEDALWALLMLEHWFRACMDHTAGAAAPSRVVGAAFP